MPKMTFWRWVGVIVLVLAIAYFLAMVVTGYLMHESASRRLEAAVQAMEDSIDFFPPPQNEWRWEKISNEEKSEFLRVFRKQAAEEFFHFDSNRRQKALAQIDRVEAKLAQLP